jgi:hypothetical protein
MTRPRFRCRSTTLLVTWLFGFVGADANAWQPASGKADEPAKPLAGALTDLTNAPNGNGISEAQLNKALEPLNKSVAALAKNVSELRKGMSKIDELEKRITALENPPAGASDTDTDETQSDAGSDAKAAKKPQRASSELTIPKTEHKLIKEFIDGGWHFKGQTADGQSVILTLPKTVEPKGTKRVDVQPTWLCSPPVVTAQYVCPTQVYVTPVRKHGLGWLCR